MEIFFSNGSSRLLHRIKKMLPHMENQKFRKMMNTTEKLNTRRKCTVEGCERLGRNKGFANGVRRYDNKCEFHHRTNYKEKTSVGKMFNKKINLDNSKCSVCGWNEAPCDRHRKDPSGDYTDDNVIILCPNCHRIEEMKKWGAGESPRYKFWGGQPAHPIER